MNKFDATDLATMKQFEDDYASLASRIARNFFLKAEAEQEEEKLKGEALELLEKEKSLRAILTERYGDGFLDLDMK